MSVAMVKKSNDAFTMLRPYIIRMLEQPSKASVYNFNEALKVIEDDQVIQMLQEYLLIQTTEVLLQESLHSKTLPEFLTDCLMCMRSLIARTEIRTWEIFNRIISRVVCFIMKYMPDNDQEDALNQGLLSGDTVLALNDELEIAAISCITETLKCSTESVLEKVYSIVFLKKLGSILFHLQSLYVREKCREVQIAAMECVKCFINSFFESSMKNKLPDLLATFVPGISGALFNVATGNHGSAVIVTAIDTWTSLLVGVFNDKLCANQNRIVFDNTNKMGPQLIIPQKDKEWLKLASEKLSNVMSKMASLDRHSNWKVRKAVACWANSLLTNCKRSLGESVPVWLDALVSLSVDEYPSLQKYSESALNEFSIQLKPEDKKLLDVVNDNLFELAMQLPRFMKQSDESKIISAVNQLYGYINILGFNVNEFLNSSVHLEKLSLAFMKLAEIDIRNVHLLSETGDILANKVVTVRSFMKTPRQFLNFTSDFIYQRICQIWQALGRYGNVYILVDHLLDRFHQSSVYQKQAVLILNEIILGFLSNEACVKNSELTNSTLKWIIDEYLEPSVWNLEITRNTQDLNVFNGFVESAIQPLVAIDQRRLETSPLAFNNNVVLICLCLEGIGVCAQVLKEDFKLFLRRVLYDVLEKCGSDNLLVSDTAMKCLKTIALSCGYNDIVQLIMDNSDYLLNSITLKLIHQLLDPKVPIVLNVSLQFGTKDMLIVIEDVITEMLNCIDRLTGTQIVPYIIVLNSFCLALLRWFPPNKCDEKINQVEAETVKDFIWKLHHQKLASQDFEDDDPKPEILTDDHFKTFEGEEGDMLPENNDSSENYPVHIKMVAKVLERCGHLLPISTPIVCYWVVNVINNAVHILHGYDNILFPSVHKIWPSLSNRFIVESHLVVQAAFRTLCTLVDACGDFVKSRIIKDVWPKLLDFLKKESKRKNHSEYSPSFKLLKRVLLDLGSVAKKLDFSVFELDTLVSYAILFVYSYHHHTIRMAAAKLLDELLVLNTDLMWLKLQDITSAESDGNDVFQNRIITELMKKL